MKLVIVESPTKSKTITKYLGKDFKVVASMGHIRDLAVGNKISLGVDIQNDFAPIYEISSNKKTIVNRLKENCKAASEVYLATDPDREGEAISWHLAQVLDLPVDSTKRLEFHEITKRAIQDSLDHPRTIDMNLVASQETRRILDRIIGFDLSQLLQSKIHLKSAGRVQSVVVKMIVEKEKEIETFQEKEYFVIAGTIKADNQDVPFTVINDQKEEIRFENETEALRAIELIKQAALTVKNVSIEQKKRSSFPVFTTSTLQQLASTYLKFDSKKTMKIAQSLYEGIDLGNGPVGLITYMRTDSVRVSPLFISLAKKKIEENYGPEYVGTAKIFNSKNNNVQDAHEGIRPTDISITPEMVEKSGNKDAAKLYQLIYSRAVASMMKDEQYTKTEVTIAADPYQLLCVGEETTFSGFVAEYQKIAKMERTPLKVKIDENTHLKMGKIQSKKSKTKGPSRYSEASLIQTMEKEGIGRPSTYASTIDLIKKRNYVVVEKGTFRPTEQGKLLIDKLNANFSDFINIKYTSNMESELDEIAEGTLTRSKMLHDFYDKFDRLLKDARKNMPKEEIAPEDLGTCPNCGKILVRRVSRYGSFVACSGYPQCKFILNENKSGKECPKCHKGTLIQRTGKYGKFYACSCFPDCDYTEK